MRTALCLSILLALVACSATTQSDRQFEDAIVADRVREALRNDPELRRYTLTVNVREGVVTLMGTVGSQGEVSRAVRIAETVPGVAKVEDLLNIGG